MTKKAAQKKQIEGEMSGRYVSQADAARQRGVELSVLNQWMRRGRVRSKDAYGRKVVHLGDVLAYDPTVNKGGRGRKAGT